MKPQEREYVRYRMDRARETLEEAELMLSRGHLHGAVNRGYYACFYSVSALLLTEGLYSSKHSGVLALFDQHWIKTGRLAVEMGRFYRLLFQQRQKSDYEDLVMVDAEDLKRWLGEAARFVEKISSIIDEGV